MRTLTLTHTHDEKTWELTLSEANTLIGMRRTRLRLAAREDSDGQEADGFDIERQVLGAVVYPDLVAAVVAQAGFSSWPVAFEDFLELPEALIAAWEEACYSLNPHWLSRNKPDEAQEKKQPTI